MYYYIYDSFVQGRQHAKELAAVETRLADFGISGNIGRLSLFRDAGELIRDEVKRGAKTVIVVGNDNTMRKVVDAVVASRAILGLIPLGEPNTLAKLLGIPHGAAACDILAKRALFTIDVGKVNGRYFISRLRIPENRLEIHCDGKFKVSTKCEGALQIRNLGWIDEGDVAEIGDPQDGLLEAVIDAKEKRAFGRGQTKRTQIPIEKLTIENQDTSPIPAFIDEEEFAQPRFEVSILKKRLRVIAGRERMV